MISLNGTGESCGELFEGKGPFISSNTAEFKNKMTQDTCSTSSAKLLLKKWMIRTVLLSNSWLVNYRQQKKNNIGKVLCVSWAVEICFYNQRSSRTCTWMSIAYSQPQIIFPELNMQILMKTQWKSNSSCSMKNNKALPGIQGKEKGSFLYTIYSKHCCSWVSVHTAIAYKQFCKQVEKLSFETEKVRLLQSRNLFLP